MTVSTAPAYFDTPERAERLQLVAHLLRNADVVPYVRGPAGAGKSLFATRLAASLADEATLVMLNGGQCDDVPAAVCRALGLAAGEWPAVVLDAPIEPALVVLVDDADDLDAGAEADLLALQAAGGRLLLLGRGDAAMPDQWPLQLIDLPPFTEAQARDFLAFAGGVEAALLSDAALHRLHQQSGGQPGLLLAGPAGDSIGSVGELPAGSPWKWLLGASVAAVVILVLWQQEHINALFSPPPPATKPALVDAPRPAEQQAPVADNRIAIPPLPPEPAPAVVPGEAEMAVPAEPRTAPGMDALPALPEPAGQVTTGPAIPQEAPLIPPPAIEAPVAVPAPESVPAEASDAPLAIMRAPEPAPEAPLPAEPVPMAELAPPAPVAAPASESVVPPAAAPVVSVPATSPRPPLATAPAMTDDLAWLRSRQPSHFTLQLLGVRERAAIDQFIRVHRLKGKYAVFARDLNGKPWYSLVYGDYPDRDAALRGRAALPASLRGASVWPRTFASVWEQLPTAGQPR